LWGTDDATLNATTPPRHEAKGGTVAGGMGCFGKRPRQNVFSGGGHRWERFFLQIRRRAKDLGPGGGEGKQNIKQKRKKKQFFNARWGDMRPVYGTSSPKVAEVRAKKNGALEKRRYQGAFRENPIKNTAAWMTTKKEAPPVQRENRTR